ncbi:MAG TPA: SRPBCC family protein [Micrococcaceae bacterium]|jgi:uncharacterized protein YndB with AHSA1/START domain|nr:SRPBCC family protein [Micrococcaceae bacterium]
MNESNSNRNINTDMGRHPLGNADRLDDGRVRLTFEREYPYPAGRVWQALTDPTQTEKWWARSRGSLRAGSSFDLQWLNAKDEGHGTEMDWWNGKVLACEPPGLFEISNSMHGTIRMELSTTSVGAVEDGTRLVFTNVISAPDEVVLMSLAGWHTHLDHLQEALAGRSIDWQHWWDDLYPSWEKIHADYTAGDR